MSALDERATAQPAGRSTIQVSHIERLCMMLPALIYVGVVVPAPAVELGESEQRARVYHHSVMLTLAEFCTCHVNPFRIEMVTLFLVHWLGAVLNRTDQADSHPSAASYSQGAGSGAAWQGNGQGSQTWSAAIAAVASTLCQYFNTGRRESVGLTVHGMNFMRRNVKRGGS